MLMQERDRLRKLADELRTHGTFVGFGGSDSRDPLMHEAAEAMESAADTIWDLHKKLVASNAEVRKERAENEKLIVKLNAEHIARQNVEIENAKLKEMLQRTWDVFHDATAREFITVKNELRELGVEVD